MPGSSPPEIFMPELVLTTIQDKNTSYKASILGIEENGVDKVLYLQERGSTTFDSELEFDATGLSVANPIAGLGQADFDLIESGSYDGDGGFTVEDAGVTTQYRLRLEESGSNLVVKAHAV